MTNIYLKATDEASLFALLIAAGVVREVQQPVYELVDTGVLERWVILSRGDGLCELIDPTEDAIAEQLADGFVVRTDETYPRMASRQTGEQTLRVPQPGFALDVIGQIVKPAGAMLTVDGAEVPEMAAIDGYHANLRGELSDEQCGALADVLLPAPPAQPYRVWA